jgi:hypothetical protein
MLIDFCQPAYHTHTVTRLGAAATGIDQRNMPHKIITLFRILPYIFCPCRVSPYLSVACRTSMWRHTSSNLDDSTKHKLEKKKCFLFYFMSLATCFVACGLINWKLYYMEFWGWDIIYGIIVTVEYVHFPLLKVNTTSETDPITKTLCFYL